MGNKFSQLSSIGYQQNTLILAICYIRPPISIDGVSRYNLSYPTCSENICVTITPLFGDLPPPLSNLSPSIGYICFKFFSNYNSFHLFQLMTVQSK